MYGVRLLMFLMIIALYLKVILYNKVEANCNTRCKKNIFKTDDSQLRTFIFTRFWELRLINSPEFATFIGVHKYDHRLDEMSLSSYQRREDEYNVLLKQVKELRNISQASSISLNLELLESHLTQFISGQKYKTYVWPVNIGEGPQIDFPRLLTWMKKNTKEDVITIIKRMRLFPQQMEETITLMREGIRIGLTMHNISIVRLPKVLRKMAEEAVTNSPVFKSFVKKPDGVTDNDWTELVIKAKNIIKDSIQPSYMKLAKFIEVEYLHHTRPHIGVDTLPNGRDFYAACLRFFTTTNLTAREIHDIGLKEVARITHRMMEVKGKVKYNGSLNAFRNYLRTDARFNYSNAEDILNNYKDKRNIIHQLLFKYFSAIPTVPYIIIPVPVEVAPTYPGAFYLAPSKDGSRPGMLFINTYKPETRKRYEAVTLSLHEAEPGHHLQSALTIEHGSTFNFRRFMEDRKDYLPPPPPHRSLRIQLTWRVGGCIRNF